MLIELEVIQKTSVIQKYPTLTKILLSSLPFTLKMSFLFRQKWKKIVSSFEKCFV